MGNNKTSRLAVIGRSRSGTTVLRHTLSTHPKIHLTNELHIYEYAYMYPDTYFQRLAVRAAKGIHYTPSTFNTEDGFVNKCAVGSKDLEPDEKIMAAEKAIFDDKFEIVGDKFGLVAKDIEIISRPLLNIPMKIIHIVRDGRDSVSSGIRKSKGVVRDKWNTVDPYKGSLNWARCLENWFTIANDLDKNNFITIKLEDVIASSEKTLRLLADFIGVENDFKNQFKKGKANIGRYKNSIPEWKKEFAPEAIEMLKKLEYIK